MELRWSGSAHRTGAPALPRSVSHRRCNHDTRAEVIRAKVGVLELAKQLGNVSQACKMMGYSRDSFYRFKELYDKGGELALAEISRKKPILKNRVASEIEAAVVALAIEQPTWGQVRVANELKKQSLSISPFGVRAVWLRHDLANTKTRLKALEARMAQEALSSPKPRSWRWRSQDREGGPRRVRERMSRLLRRPGHLLCRQHEGRGPHLSADLHRYLHQGGLRQALRPQDANHRGGDFLNDRVLPFFEEHGIVLCRVLTDRGTEYCGNPEHHDYELYLAVEDIDHTRTKTKSPQTNGLRAVPSNRAR